MHGKFLQLWTKTRRHELKVQTTTWNCLHSLPQQSVWSLRSMTQPQINKHLQICQEEEVGPVKKAPGFAGAFPI